jgi:hypothetical protein
MENKSISTPWKDILHPAKIAIITCLGIFIPISISAFYIGNPFEYISEKYGGILLFLIVIFAIYFASATIFSLYKILKTFNISYFYLLY